MIPCFVCSFRENQWNFTPLGAHRTVRDNLLFNHMGTRSSTSAVSPRAAADKHASACRYLDNRSTGRSWLVPHPGSRVRKRASTEAGMVSSNSVQISASCSAALSWQRPVLATLDGGRLALTLRHLDPSAPRCADERQRLRRWLCRYIPLLAHAKGDSAFFALFQRAETSGVTGHREKWQLCHLLYCRINTSFRLVNNFSSIVYLHCQ